MNHLTKYYHYYLPPRNFKALLEAQWKHLNKCSKEFQKPLWIIQWISFSYGENEKERLSALFKIIEKFNGRAGTRILKSLFLIIIAFTKKYFSKIHYSIWKSPGKFIAILISGQYILIFGFDRFKQLCSDYNFGFIYINKGSTKKTKSIFLSIFYCR